MLSYFTKSLLKLTVRSDICLLNPLFPPPQVCQVSAQQPVQTELLMRYHQLQSRLATLKIENEEVRICDGSVHLHTHHLQSQPPSKQKTLSHLPLSQVGGPHHHLFLLLLLSDDPDPVGGRMYLDCHNASVVLFMEFYMKLSTG